MTPSAPRQHLVALALAVATAGLQLGIAWHWKGRTEHVSAVALGWGAALWLAWMERDRWRDHAGDRREVVLGAVIVGGTWVALLHGRAAYGVVNRFLPLVAGFGFVVIATGARRLTTFWRQLLLLSLAIAYPLPYALRLLVTPTPITAAASAGAMRLLGFTVERQGTLLVFPDSTLRVLELCSGIVLMTQMAVLAIVVVCLVPMTLSRAVAALAVGVATGFLVNAARITMLGIVAYRSPGQFAYWEEYVTGSVLVPAIATGLGGLLWWRILRRRPEAAIASSSRKCDGGQPRRGWPP